MKIIQGMNTNKRPNFEIIRGKLNFCIYLIFVVLNKFSKVPIDTCAAKEVIRIKGNKKRFFTYISLTVTFTKEIDEIEFVA